MKKALALFLFLAAITLAFMLASDESLSAEMMTKGASPEYLLGRPGLTVVLFTKDDCPKCKEFISKVMKAGADLPDDVKVSFMEANLDEQRSGEPFKHKDQLPLCFILKDGAVIAEVPASITEEGLIKSLILLSKK